MPSIADRIALNDVVITKAALSRIIDLSVAVGDAAGHARARRRPDRRDADRIDGLQPRRRRPDRASGRRRDAADADRAAHAHQPAGRPPGASEVRVEPIMDGSHDEVFVTFDGQSGHALQADDVIEIRKAERPLRLVRASKRTYFEVLRQKLKWGER